MSDESACLIFHAAHVLVDEQFTEVADVSNRLCVFPFPGLQADDLDVGQKDNLTAVMESMGIYGADLRTHASDGAAAVNETQRLLKILLTTLKKAVSQGSLSVQSKKPSAGSPLDPETDLKRQKELVSQTNYTEVRRAAGLVGPVRKQRRGRANKQSV